MIHLKPRTQNFTNSRESFYDRQSKSELQTTQRQLLDCQAELERHKQLLAHYKSQNAQYEMELAKTQLSLDTVFKELSARTGSVQHLTNVNSRLKCDLEGVPQFEPVAVKSGVKYNPTQPNIRNTANSRVTSTSSSVHGISLDKTRSSTVNTPRNQQYASATVSSSYECFPIPIHPDVKLITEGTDERSFLEPFQREIEQGEKLPSHESAVITTSIHTIPFEGNVLHAKAPLSLYIQRCFNDNIDPCVTVLRSLYEGTTLKCGSVDAPILYSQMNHLLNVFLSKESLLTRDMKHWHHFTRLSVCTENEETFELVSGLMEHLPYLCELEVSGMTDGAAQRFAGAISIADNLHKLEMPDIKVGDEGFQVIMKVVANRFAAVTGSETGKVTHLADSGDDPHSVFSPNQSKDHSCTPIGYSGNIISITNLDLSGTNLCEATSFYLIRGHFIETINFEGLIGLRDKFLGEVIRSCPNLKELNINRCHSLTKDVIMYINLAKNLKTLKLIGCPAINNVRLYFVKEFHSDFRGITHFDAPELSILPYPLANFSCVTFECPNLQMISFQGAILTRREFNILSECKNLLSVDFINCRISTLEVFLRKMRKLVRLSIHGCKGVVDSDLSTLCCFIESLDLTDCFCVTDDVLKRLGESLKVLSRLVLKRCSSVTDGGLSYIAKCVNLKYLNVLGMRKVTHEGVTRLCCQMPWIRHVVHETFNAADLQIDRRDDEEDQKALMAYEERLIITRRQDVALEYVSSSSTIASLKRDTLKSPMPPQVASVDVYRPQSRREDIFPISENMLESHDSDRVPNGWKSPVRMRSRPITADKEVMCNLMSEMVCCSEEKPVVQTDSAEENKVDDNLFENGEKNSDPLPDEIVVV